MVIPTLPSTTLARESANRFRVGGFLNLMVFPGPTLRHIGTTILMTTTGNPQAPSGPRLQPDQPRQERADDRQHPIDLLRCSPHTPPGPVSVDIDPALSCSDGATNDLAGFPYLTSQQACPHALSISCELPICLFASRSQGNGSDY